MYSDSELLGPRRLPVRAAKRLALPPLLRLFRGFATIGDNNEAYLAHYGVPRNRMFRTPYPTDEESFRTALFRRAEHRAAVRAELAIDDDAFVALFVGKLVQRKRPLDIAGALRVIAAGSPATARVTPDWARSQVPVHSVGTAAPVRSAGAGGTPIVAVLAGDGELRPHLEAAATELDGALRLVGFADQERLPKLYAAADVCLHPAEQDAHPLAIKEAVLCGLPVITTDRVGSVGATDDVRSGRNGVVYPVGDVQHLARILDDLSRRPEDLKRMSKESTNIASEIGIDATVEGFVRAFSSVSSAQI
ncbi:MULTISPECIES: glycosyltransferase family 4 protein [Parafrankia]|nr:MULTISPECIES: glycosyltransferase family 4 protein [Parafrankia]